MEEEAPTLQGPGPCSLGSSAAGRKRLPGEELGVHASSGHRPGKGTVPVLLVRAHLYLEPPAVPQSPRHQAAASHEADEATDVVHWLCMGMTLLGLIILSRLPDMIFTSQSFVTRVENIMYWYGFAAAIASTILGAAVIVFLRQLRSVSILVVQINHTSFAMFELLLINMAVSPWIPPTFPRCGHLDSFSLITISVLTLFAQLSLTASLKTEQAGPVALVRFAGRVFFVFILQVVFLNEIPDLHSITAATLVLTSMLLSTYRKYRLQKRATAQSREEKDLVKRNDKIELQTADGKSIDKETAL